MLTGRGVLDVFHCLRLPGEPSFAGGVFVTIACHDTKSWGMMRDKGHVVAQNGRTAMIALPRHLLGLEAATTVFELPLQGCSSGGQRPCPVIDLTAHADRDLRAGTLLVAEGHHHTIAGGVVAHDACGGGVGCDAHPLLSCRRGRLLRDVAAGQPILCGDVDLDTGSELLALRRAQDGVVDWN